MKKLTIITVCLLAFLAGYANAESYFGGVIYDSETGVDARLGTAQPLTGSLYAFPQVRIGDYQDEIDALIGYYIGLGMFQRDLGIFLIAGPTAEWQGVSDPTSYLTGAGGAVVTYTPSTVGGWAGAKYNFSTDGSAQYYKDGWTVGLGVAITLE